ncbi:glycosyltransferase family 2 protein [Aquiluna borgnonia]|uniref:Glycosyltransferase family 2 protein n=1 Tax=Aquiluna borgnonia TaxID=2499157 RepID=A0A7D4UD74_9MICO|nr:glycosyltransferase family 2 protein [Aquiluna borgnonia]QKJ25054.1 glycosyltransferase family 2 protein [Aquiluna borgnonia]
MISPSSSLVENKVPVAIVIFRRPELTKRVLAALSLTKPERLFVIADGPRPGRPDDIEAVSAARALFEDLDWKCEVTKIYSATNLGLRARVISGLDEVFRQVDSAIILEDDCLPSSSFFKFASELIDRYKDEPTVALVSANNFAPKKSRENTYYFSTHANIWGWATWRRTWLDFRKSKPVSDLTEREINQILDLVGGKRQRSAFAKLLRLYSSLDSWAVQFATFIYLNRLLSAVPSQNLVTNVGFGAASTHTKFESWADEIPLGEMKFPLTHPASLEPDSREMQRESIHKTLRWITFPIAHPIEAASRIYRYLRVRA